MAQPKETRITDIYLREYESIKQEQVHRMGFRDNLIYANLIALTGVVSIVADDIVRIPVLLVLPIVCITLGWTYLVNDEKISAIGRYIRYDLTDHVKELLGTDDPLVFGWETAHRADNRRISRKYIQLIIDEFVFVLPGLTAIVIFWLNTPVTLFQLRWIAVLEAIFLAVLGFQIFIYADLRRGR